MESTQNSAKRKQPDEPGDNLEQAVAKRRRQHAPDDFEHEADDAEKHNMEFLTQPHVKEDLLEELLLLQVPETFEDDHPDLADDENMTNSRADASSGAHADQPKQPQVEVIDVDSLENNQGSKQNIATAQPQPLLPYRPIPWGLEDAHTDEHMLQVLASAEEHPESAEAFRNRSWLHSSDEQQQGSLWSQVRHHQLQFLLVDPRFVLRSPQVERDDFLKAYMRLQHFAHPNRLSVLLGPASRPKKYCEFLLNFMLDLYNTKEVAAKTGPRRCSIKYPNLTVYQDGYYADKDPIVRRLDALEEKREQAVEAAGPPPSTEGKGDTYQEELIHLAEDRADDESDEEEPDITGYKSQGLQLQDDEMDQLCDFASYILRSYMYNVSGETFYSPDQFGKYCQQQGISFLHSEQAAVEFDRLKWLDEPVLAPTLGEAKTIKEPLKLWQHAINTFSVKSLARCALIQSDSLLDWLEYVTRMKNNPSTLDDFYASERPVVCFAPVVLLYLADAAVAFALEVIRVAMKSVEQHELFEEKHEKVYEEMKELDDEIAESKPAENEEPAEKCSTRIERTDIHRAASHKFMSSLQASSFFLNQILQAEPLPDGSLNPRWFEAEWPQRKVRPYTASTEFEICSRDPAVKVNVPHSAMIETRAILMGIKSPHHMSLYTKGSSSRGVPKRLRKFHQKRTEGVHKLAHKAKGGGDVEMKDKVNKVVGKKSNIVPPPRTELDQSAENIVYKDAEKHGREEGNELHFSGGGALAKDNETKPATDIIVDVDAKNVPGDEMKRQQDMEPDSQKLGKPSREAAPKSLKSDKDVVTKDATSEQESERREKYATFFGVPNPAEAIIASVGVREWRNISFEDMKTTLAKLKGKSTTEDGGASTEQGEGDNLLRHRASSICYNRLRWIVLHALGISADEKLSAERPLDYASTANYANFRQFRSKKPLAISDGAFFLLAQLTEQLVRHEAEILMDCAAHDDGRPWIDRADVALVHSVRKNEFPYNDL